MQRSVWEIGDHNLRILSLCLLFLPFQESSGCFNRTFPASLFWFFWQKDVGLSISALILVLLRTKWTSIVDMETLYPYVPLLQAFTPHRSLSVSAHTPVTSCSCCCLMSRVYQLFLGREGKGHLCGTYSTIWKSIWSVVLFIIVKCWKQLLCISRSEFFKRLWHVTI
jgi:hypothetical protein